MYSLKVIRYLIVAFLNEFVHSQPPPGIAGESINLPKSPKGHCRVVFNEIDTDNPGENDRQFIELTRECDTGHKRSRSTGTHGYRLLIIRGYPLSLVLSVDLSRYSMNQKSGQNPILVLGSSKVPNTKILLSGDDVASIFKGHGDLNLLPVGDDSPYAIVLVYSASPKYSSDLTLPKNAQGQYVPLSLEGDPRARKIKELAQDMVVFGRKVPANTCSFFDEIWPESVEVTESKRYLVRDFDTGNAADTDFSLNRCCPEIVPFNPECFKFGKPTPGLVNDCTGENFFLEGTIDRISPFVPTSVSDPTIPGCSSTLGNIPPERYVEINEERLHETIEDGLRNPKCARRVNPESAVATEEMEVEVNNQLIIRSGGTPVTPWYHKHSFKPEWVEKCGSQFTNNGDVLLKPTVQRWLNIDIRNDRCYLSCSVCIRFYKDGFRADVRRKKSITTPEGVWYKNRYHMTSAVTEHDHNDEVHCAAINWSDVLDKVATETEYNRAKKETMEREQERYAPTIRLITMVYAEIITGNSFESHKIFVDALEAMNVNVGTHHHHGKGAMHVLEVISDIYKRTLLSYLVRSRNYFSLLVDSSTDNRNIPYLIVYIQTLEDGYPIVYFYGLIPLIYGESAEETFRVVKERVEEDDKMQQGFESFFKKYLMVFSSDGANVMIGKNKSFHTELIKYLGRTIPSVHCMAHKLNLSIQRAVTKSKNKQFKYFTAYEKGLNRFYLFYMSRGSKKWSHLQAVAVESNITIKRIKYFFDVRWASSVFEVNLAIHHNYDVLVPDLIEIHSDSTFTEAARNEAMDLHNMLTDKSFAIVNRENLDFLAVYKMMSLTLQQSAGLLIGKSEIVLQGIKAFRELRITPGKYIREFLAKCSCANVCSIGQCTMEQYDSCKYVTYNGQTVYSLQDLDPEGIKLSTERSKLYDELIKQVEFYFDVDVLAAFDLLDLRKLVQPTCSPGTSGRQYNVPTTLDDAYIPDPLYGSPSQKMKRLCTFYKFSTEDCTQLAKELLVLVVEIAQVDSVMVNVHNEDPSRVWPYIRSLESYPFTDLTNKLVDLALVTPFGTSDCERGFSYLTSTKADRGNLSPEHLEMDLNVIINGPGDVKRFDASRVADEFLKKFVRVDDKSFAGGRKSLTAKQRSFFRSSRLF